MIKKFLNDIRKKWWNSIVGLFTAVKQEKSIWGYLFMFPFIIGFGVWTDLSLSKWLIIIIVYLITIAIEIINTAIESTADAISFQYNIKVKRIKDIAAGATLVMTMTLIITLLIIFIPAIKGAI